VSAYGETVREAFEKLMAENRRLRDALELVLVAPLATDDAYKIARAALDGTPSATQTLEDVQATSGAE
jgi:hypothetical protein